MSGFTVTTLDEIEPLDDGRTPLKPVRHQLGITAFGVNAWTARAAGDRMKFRNAAASGLRDSRVRAIG